MTEKPTTQTYDYDPRISDLRTFLAVARTGAQETGGVLQGNSQSEVSRRVVRVSKFFGFDLFERAPSGAQALSARGEIVRAHLEQALALIDRALLQESDVLRIAFTPVARKLLSAAIQRMPEAVLANYRIREATSIFFVEALLRREIDVALGFDLGLTGLAAHHIGREEILDENLLLVIPSKVADEEPATVVEALAALRRCYVQKPSTPPAPLASYDTVTAWLRSQEVSVVPQDEVGCVTAGEMFALISTGRFYGLLPPLCYDGSEGVAWYDTPGLVQTVAFNAFFREESRESLLELVQVLKTVSRERRMKPKRFSGGRRRAKAGAKSSRRSR